MIRAGRVITADLLNRERPKILVKTLPQTANSTAYVYDDELFCLLEPNTVYYIKLVTRAVSGNYNVSSDYKSSFVVPPGSFGYRAIAGAATTMTSVSGTDMQYSPPVPWEQALSVGTDDSASVSIQQGTLITGSQGGPLQHRFGELSNESIGVTVDRCSVLIVEQMGKA